MSILGTMIIKVSPKYLLLYLLFVSGCGNPICAWNAFALQPEVIGYTPEGEEVLKPILFDTNFDETTLSGISIDRWSSSVDLEYIDLTVEKMVNCVQELINIKYKASIKAQCLENPLRQRQDPCLQECLKIKIVEPIESECSEWNFIGRRAPQHYCDMKNLTTDCPCNWRWIVQRDYEYVTTTGRDGRTYLYEVVKIMSGCNNIWEDPELTKCANIN